MDSTVLHLMNLAHHPWKARLYTTSTTSSIPNTQPTVCGLDTVEYDPLGSIAVTGAQSGASSAHMVIPVSGYYLVCAELDLAPGNAISNGILSIYKNPTFSGNAFLTGEVRRGNRLGSVAATELGLTISTIVKLAAGDKLYLGIYQDSGVTISSSIAGSGLASYMECHFLSPA